MVGYELELAVRRVGVAEVGKCLAIVLLLLLVATGGGLKGQSVGGEVELGVFGGLGSGLVSMVPWGLSAGVGLADHVAVRGEFQGWGSRGSCNTIVPDFYRCSVSGRAALVGIRASTRGPVSLFLEGKTGYHSRSGVEQESERVSTVPVELSGGIQFDLGSRFWLELSTGYMWVSDEEFEELFGDDLGHRFVQLGFGVALGASSGQG